MYCLADALWRYDSNLFHSDAAESVCLSFAVCHLRFGTRVCPIGRTERVLVVFFLCAIAAARRFDQHGRSGQR